MNWYIYIFLSKIFDSTTTLIGKSIFNSHKISPISLWMLNCYIAGFFTLLFGLTQPTFGLIPGHSIPWLSIFIMMILYGFGSVFFYIAIEMIDASKMAIISASSTVFAILSCVIFLNESLNTLQYIGGTIILLGIIVTTISKSKIKFGKGEIYALIGSALFGLQTANDKILLRDFGSNYYLFIAFLLPPLLISVFYFKHARGIPTTLKTIGLPLMLVYGFAFAIQAILFYIGLNLTNSVSLLVILNLSGRVLTVILSILILKETRFLWQKIIGTGIVIVGLLVLALK